MIKFNNFFLGHHGTYKPYKHNLYIEIIIFPLIDNTQSTGHNLRGKWDKEKYERSVGTH